MWMAGRLSIEHFMRGDPAVGAGWLMKAQHLAEDTPEGVGHGLLLIVEATVARFSGDVPGALELVDEATELGRRLDDPDLSAMATHMQGVAAGRGGRRRARGGAPRRGDDQRRGRAAEPVLHRHRLLQRDRHLPRDRGRPQGGSMERGCARVVRDAPARVPVPGDVPGEPSGGREAPRRVAGGRGGSDASLGRADGLRSDGRGTGVLRDGRDPPADRQPRPARRSASPARGRSASIRSRGCRCCAPRTATRTLRVAGLRLAATTITESRLRRARVLGALVDVALSIGDVDGASEAADLWRRSRQIPTPRSWRRWPRRRPARSCSPGETRRPPSIAYATPCASWRDLRSPTRAHGPASSTRSRSGPRATRTTPSSSSGRRSPRSIAWARPRTATRPPRSCRERVAPARTHAARGGGPPARRGREVEPRHRRRARDQRAHGRPAPPEHVREARRLLPVGGDRVRVRARPRLIAPSAWCVLTMRGRSADWLVPAMRRYRGETYRALIRANGRAAMSIEGTERVETVIVGGGQAGLATGLLPAAAGRPR